MGTSVVLDPVPASFDDIEDLHSGSVYPRLEGFQTALCLFCAEWHGRQDAYWIAKQGMTGTCVDLNAKHLREMQEVYPSGWEFIKADVYEWETDRTWDVVTLDPWTGQFERCADLLPRWCSLANHVVVLGHGNYRLTEPQAPDGWRQDVKIKRSDYKGGINWLVFRRA